MRESRYALLQGFFHGADDSPQDDIEAAHTHLRAVTVTEGSGAIGKQLLELDLAGARITTLVRKSTRSVDPPGEMRVVFGDTLVLSGTLEQVGTAEASLLRA